MSGINRHAVWREGMTGTSGMHTEVIPPKLKDKSNMTNWPALAARQKAADRHVG
jgi:hypothetical protein